MRLLILHQAWVFGGAERTTSYLLSNLDRGAVEHITLAAPAALRAFMPQTFDDFVDTAALIKQGWFGSPQGLRDDVRSAARLLRDTRPDVALGMMHYSAALVALGARGAGVKARTIGSFRGPAHEYIRRYERGARRVLFLHLAIGLTARLADRILVPSQGTAADTCRRFFGSPDRTLVIPNGIDATAVSAAAQGPAAGLERLPPDLPRLCVAARLSVEKDVGVLIDAIRRVQIVQPCALAIVGDGPDRANLEQRVSDLGLGDRVVFVGHRENVYPYMRQADVYVHTCQFEGFGYTMLESMACGTPVVATDCPHGPREVLGGGDYGVLVAPGDAGALADGISQLLTDPARRQRLRELGLQRAKDLSVERMVAGYQAVFQGLVHSG